MSVDERFDAFKVAFAAGEDPDPLAALEGFAGAERAQLRALLDAFLARAPAPAFDADEFARFRSSAVAQRVRAAVTAGGERLADLRHAAQVEREQLVADLAEALEAPDRRAKVADYYHQLEFGRLDPRRVSQRVYEVLAGSLGMSLDRVRQAAARVSPPPSAAAMHARKALPDPTYLDDGAIPGAVPAPASPGTPSEEPDAIDRAFLGEDLAE